MSDNTSLLDIRKMRILQAIIDDYIMTAAPVGSRTISKRSDMGLSPATIRNEMSDLTELGFLEQPHTSAGRVPSEKAYRLYVNHLMDSAKLTDDEAEYIKRHLDTRVHEVGEVIRQTAKVLSDMTKYTSMVLVPQLSSMKVKRISLIPVSDGTALAVVVTNTGVTKNAMIKIPDTLSPDDIEKISKLLTAKLDGHRMSDAIESVLPMIREEVGEQADAVCVMLEDIERSMSETDVEVVGASNILDYPEYSDTAKARSFLTEVETGNYLQKVLTDSSDVEMSVRIGTENDNPDMRDCSVVTVTYKAGGKNIGSMGVVGPTRMDYGKVMAILKYMSSSLSDILSKLLK
ncbi:MAG: heat-inducible transcription repressor HrcA [Clostridia bacterium]|nr:heat-inducible transcription repressor HrcA [Clostridia bacterium]MBR3459972.1 heat-inducible transcription repressor HrcA [Clostridia bacterium]MBR5718113.1 heat-inducible transcription repressor HrcA [Clostridia bacterium]